MPGEEDPGEDQDKEHDQDEREIREVTDVTTAYIQDEWQYNDSAAGAPVWLLPEGSKSLCSVVGVLVSGLRSALQRYSGLFPEAHLDGKDVSEDVLLSLLSSKPSYLSLPSGLHTLNLELINISSDGKKEGLWTGGCCGACVSLLGVHHVAECSWPHAKIFLSTKCFPMHLRLSV